MTSFDVIVIGAGPAGVASALKCTEKGYQTLLVERAQPGRHKPCGGVIPTLCADMLEEEFGLRLPPDVMCSPETLGLFYVPPSGRDNGGERSNYKLFNLDRDRFDEWLGKSAQESGVQVLYGARFLELQKSSGMIRVSVKEKESVTELKSRYLIGADGAFSRVRTGINPDSEYKTLKIYQEHWRAEGDFDNYFYVFLKEDVTPTYAYLIPKNGFFIIGTGVPAGYHITAQECLHRFKELLKQEFAFKPLSLERKEIGTIPYPSTVTGKGDVILAGDAAGFCNSFSGEGIRLAIESGIAAGEAIAQADKNGDSPSVLYSRQVKGLSEFVRRTYQFSISLKDSDREQFVGTQVKRPCTFSYHN